MAEKIVTMDLRAMPVLERHPRIFDAWEGLEPEETLRIINDHDPKPLRYQFEGEFKDLFDWRYAAQGPDEWVVDIRKLEMPHATGEKLRNDIMEGLDEVRPYLKADGGDVELIDIDEAGKVVKVRLTGACGGCPSAAMTLKAGVEKAVKKMAPWIKRVEPA